MEVLICSAFISLSECRTEAEFYPRFIFISWTFGYYLSFFPNVTGVMGWYAWVFLAQIFSCATPLPIFLEAERSCTIRSLNIAVPFRYTVFTTWLSNGFNPFCSDRKLWTWSQSQFPNNFLKIRTSLKKISSFTNWKKHSLKNPSKTLSTTHLIFPVTSFFEGNWAFLRS